MDPKTVQLVDAARSGDDRALNELIARHLEMLYNVVGRALEDPADVDDVVQETLLQVVRDLPGLRAPERFRPWLVTIALHQISGRRQARQRDDRLIAPLDEVDDLPDRNADFTDLSILRLSLSGQRRQVAE